MNATGGATSETSMLVESSSSADSIKSSRTTSSSGSDFGVENPLLQRLGAILSLLTGISGSDPYLCPEPFLLGASHASLKNVLLTWIGHLAL